MSCLGYRDCYSFCVSKTDFIALSSTHPILGSLLHEVGESTSTGPALTFPISDTVLGCVTSCQLNAGVVGGMWGAELLISWQGSSDTEGPVLGRWYCLHFLKFNAVMQKLGNEYIPSIDLASFLQCAHYQLLLQDCPDLVYFGLRHRKIAC